ncbi:hypothetical protein BZA05DRAFT_181163 [Tricharina praecox]|uniref:uncharacterized protein n=1 Tax=Tricharina praecox TaxID=43433 RepID=UPI00221F1C4C|nr:uncharacterized protein BZA05DRAFT_181163 [Tricharina praecox]KAI5843764.1 hypothetical protein BZA05DRAFT_181163 [Tricharina praecox]
MSGWDLILCALFFRLMFFCPSTPPTHIVGLRIGLDWIGWIGSVGLGLCAVSWRVPRRWEKKRKKRKGLTRGESTVSYQRESVLIISNSIVKTPSNA